VTSDCFVARSIMRVSCCGLQTVTSVLAHDLRCYLAMLSGVQCCRETHCNLGVCLSCVV